MFLLNAGLNKRGFTHDKTVSQAQSPGNAQNAHTIMKQLLNKQNEFYE